MVTVCVQMYNQTTGMGDPRPPLSLPNMPLPPDLPGLHQDKAINLHVERQRALEEIRRKEEDNMMKMDADRKEMEEREETTTISMSGRILHKGDLRCLRQS